MTTTAYDLELSSLMQRYWINFAASGNPNGEGLPQWPLYERPAPQVLELGDAVRSTAPVEPELCNAFAAKLE
jgi:para-nitrobenzyl esterase